MRKTLARLTRSSWSPSRSMVLYGPVFRREVRSWLPLFGPLLGPWSFVWSRISSGGSFVASSIWSPIRSMVLLWSRISSGGSLVASSIWSPIRSMVLYGPVFLREVRSWLPLFGPLLGPWSFMVDICIEQSALSRAHCAERHVVEHPPPAVTPPERPEAGDGSSENRFALLLVLKIKK
jgi:hypothetical protein